MLLDLQKLIICAQNIADLFCLLYHNLTIGTIAAKSLLLAAAEFNELSSAAYRNEILLSERKILTEI